MCSQSLDSIAQHSKYAWRAVKKNNVMLILKLL